MSKTAKKIIALTSLTAVAVVIIATAAILTSGFGSGQNGSTGLLGWLIPDSGGFGFGGGGGNTQPLPSINFLILGLDDEASLPDTILAGHFNGETGYLDIISIPRDSIVTLTPEVRADFVAIGRGGSLPGDRNWIIINEMFTRAGQGNNGRVMIQNYIEAMLDIEFDYYVKIDLSAFRYIVDAVGGVEMYIPQRLFYVQGGGIDIDIPQGLQTLNGRQAEQVIRFRNHPTGDLFRMRMTQDFLSNFFEQSLNQESIMNDPLALISTFITRVDTNMGLVAVAQYNANGIFQAIDTENIVFHMVPGTMATRYNIDEEAAQQLVRDIKDGTTRQPEEEPEDE